MDLTLIKENIWFWEIFGFNFVMLIRLHLFLLKSMNQSFDHIEFIKVILDKLAVLCEVDLAVK